MIESWQKTKIKNSPNFILDEDIFFSCGTDRKSMLNDNELGVNLYVIRD